MATNYKFDDRTSHLIEELKEGTGARTSAEVLRKAIALLKVAVEANNNDEKIIVRDPNNDKEREILLW